MLKLSPTSMKLYMQKMERLKTVCQNNVAKKSVPQVPATKVNPTAVTSLKMAEQKLKKLFA